MAKIEFCAITVELNSRIKEGEYEFARREIVKLLEQGYSSRPFLRLVSTLIMDGKSYDQKGRPAKVPLRWYEIGELYEEMHKPAERNSGQVIDQIADKFGMSSRSVQRSLKYFQEMMAAADSAES
ncbi:hypothetical protein FE840_011905 [Peteryoungia desertarenae]|uniref:Uncharacterized protein n=1 Tax=Peteryoungia desertarenae TaxID=1813451 RepID=A0ABX6QPF6_9HYPH|nr:hypothetical protein [Peteryoungia desertarenae]QLF70186.1 hypothetical protein FE840_011905 [Peteryoungia desertarenae]